MAAMIDRITAGILAIVRNQLAQYFYAGVYPYSVVSFDDGAKTADLNPVFPDQVPPLTKVPVRLPGLQLKLSAGDQVLVGFEGMDPSKPVITSCSYSAQYTAALAAARQGDMTMTSVALVPAVAGVPPIPIPNTWSIFLTNPPPPPFSPAGGIASLPGCISSGSVRLKIV